MEKLNIFKIIVTLICIIISQLLVTYVVLGAIDAYYGTKFFCDLSVRFVYYSPLICILCIKILFDIFLGFIAAGLAKKEKENRLLWFAFTALFGLSALAILYLKVIHKKISMSQTER